MANATVVTQKNNVIQVAYTDSGANFDLATDIPFFTMSGIWVSKICWNPGAANDVLRIREGAADGPDLFPAWTALDATDDKQIEFNPPMRIFPYIVLSEQTFGTPASQKIFFHLA